MYTYIEYLPDSHFPIVFFARILPYITHSVTHKMDVEKVSLSCNQRSLNSRSRPNLLGIPNRAKCHLCGIMAANNRQNARHQTLSCWKYEINEHEVQLLVSCRVLIYVCKTASLGRPTDVGSLYEVYRQCTHKMTIRVIAVCTWGRSSKLVHTRLRQNWTSKTRSISNQLHYASRNYSLFKY